VAEANDIASWIGQLGNPDVAKRRTAAMKLHAAASLLLHSAAGGWIALPEFRQLVSPSPIEGGRAGGVEITEFVTGIAVPPEKFEEIRAANGSPRLCDVPPDQDAVEFELRFGDRARFDILTASDPNGAGAIARYLSKFGEGIQQIEMNVMDVDRATEILRTRFELTPVYPETRPGADGTRVNFFLAPASDGRRVLIELVQPPLGK
jgi:hypothetical protein